MRFLYFAAVFCLLAVPVSAQVKNPTILTFTSADHNHPQATGYEIDIVKPDGTIVQTITVPKASTTVNSAGSVVVAINVQPVAFGLYTFVSRLMASAIKSPNSPPSDQWERTPGAPSKPVAGE